MLEYQAYLGEKEPNEEALIGRGAGAHSNGVTLEDVTFAEVEQEFRGSIVDYLTVCIRRGGQRDWAYSGKMSPPLYPKLHRCVAAQPQAASASINQWTIGRLEQALLAPRRSEQYSPRISYEIRTLPGAQWPH